MKRISLFLCLLCLVGCGSPKSTEPFPSVPKVALPSVAGDPGVVVAELNGESITQGDLNGVIAKGMARIQNQIFELQKQGINSIIEDRLLEKEAKKRGMEAKQLLKEEAQDKVGEVPDKEAEDFFNQNRPRFGDKTFDQVKETLKQQLAARKATVYQKNFMDRLKEKADIKIFLTRPSVEVGADDDPMKGSKNAKVTVIEFTDYQCPFCGRARPTVKQIVKDYGDKIRYVLRDFPLDFHPFAKKAAEAADCAGEQGKYWEYSEILWDKQGNLEVESLKKYAGQLNLDQKKFEECLDSGKMTAEVNKDIQDGAAVGVTGTPTFFINGQLITGARPIEQFKEIIDQEIKDQKVKN